MYETTLIYKSRLRRIVEVQVGNARHTVEYYGAGFGYEEVRVDGQRAVRTRSWVWFVPRFDFELAGRSAWIEVNVALTFQIRKFVLVVGDSIVYAEGLKYYEPHQDPPWPVEHWRTARDSEKEKGSSI
jgi:hypothetical protein